MIPILYEHNEVYFETNGVCRLPDIVDCYVTEEINGIYECEFKYPMDGKHYEEIYEGRVILVTHDDTKAKEPFDIYGRSAPINGLVTFYAHHISYRLSRVICKPFTAFQSNDALYKAFHNRLNDESFHYNFDETIQGDMLKLTRPTILREILLGDDNSIVNNFPGGEFTFSGYVVSYRPRRGYDRDIAIRYGKNITKLTQETDDSETYNAVCPYWTTSNGDDEYVKTLPDYGLVLAPDLERKLFAPDGSSKLVTSEDEDFYVNEAEDVRAVPLDLSEYFEDEPTDEQMREKASEILSGSQAWMIKENISVEFEQLWESDEYSQFALLQRVNLGDRIDVINPKINLVKIKMEVVKVVYDVVREKYKSMDLGNPRKGLAETITSATNDFLKELPSKSFMEAAIEYATNMITGGLGGHVILKTNGDGQPEEILIMDTDDVRTAVNVWRFNLGGLGHSHNGYNGPFDDVALTMDGRINANMITTGILNAGLVATGILTDRSGTNWWNLDTGEIHIAAMGQIETDVGELAEAYLTLDLELGQIALEVGEKVGEDEIVSKINMSPEQIVIDSSKISLIGKDMDFVTDNIKIIAETGEYVDTGLYYDPNEIAIAEFDEHGTLVGYWRYFHIGGNKGWLDIGYENLGQVRIHAGNAWLTVANDIPSQYGGNETAIILTCGGVSLQVDSGGIWSVDSQGNKTRIG